MPDEVDEDDADAPPVPDEVDVEVVDDELAPPPEPDVLLLELVVPP